MNLLIIAFVVSAPVRLAIDDAPAALKVLESGYDRSALARDEDLRIKYVLELARLRFELVRQGGTGWKECDAEIERCPAPADSNSAVFSKLRLGIWHSPRHDYLYRANGTWIMDPPAGENTTHGTWSIKGNQYFDNSSFVPSPKAMCTIILLDEENFIYTDGSNLFFEKRTLGEGFPLRRDGT